jgi:hypothetical protein
MFYQRQSRGKYDDVNFAINKPQQRARQNRRACAGLQRRAIIPCVFLLGGKAFVVGAVVGFASRNTFFIWLYVRTAART